MKLEVVRTAVKSLCNIPGTTCKKGCNKGRFNCCYEKSVSVIPEQADIIYKKMINEKIEIDFERLEKRVTQKDLKTADLKCLFLDDNASCRIWDARPLVCIKRNAVTPSKNCDPTNKLSVGLIRNDTSEALASSAFKSKGFEDLSQAMYKRIKDGNDL